MGGTPKDHLTRGRDGYKAIKFGVMYRVNDSKLKY